MSGPSEDPSPIGANPLDFDPAGQAALLLVESLIHQLLTRSALSRSDVAEVVQCAIDAQLDIEGEQEAASSASTSRALGLLMQVKSTFDIDAMAQPGAK